jgi:hypothetical protein
MAAKRRKKTQKGTGKPGTAGCCPALGPSSTTLCGDGGQVIQNLFGLSNLLADAPAFSSWHQPAATAANPPPQQHSALRTEHSSFLADPPLISESTMSYHFPLPFPTP